MKNVLKVLTLSGFALAVASTTALGQFTVDEFGHGLPSTIAVDPSGGIAGNVLIYFMPSVVVPGDVVLIEPNQPTGTYSDIIRFFNPVGGNQSLMIFYSDFGPNDPPDAPADTGLPLQLSGNVVFVNEVGGEGNNAANYIAVSQPPGGLPGTPGWNGNANGTLYTFVSDSPVPEPSSAILLLSGLGVLIGISRARKKA